MATDHHKKPHRHHTDTRRAGGKPTSREKKAPPLSSEKTLKNRPCRLYAMAWPLVHRLSAVILRPCFKIDLLEKHLLKNIPCSCGGVERSGQIFLHDAGIRLISGAAVQRSSAN